MGFSHIKGRKKKEEGDFAFLEKKLRLETFRANRERVTGP